MIILNMFNTITVRSTWLRAGMTMGDHTDTF